MTRLEELERDVRNLTQPELERLRAWFVALDAEAWDRQIEEDARAGTLDAAADAALADHCRTRSAC
jgi:hypothetical protein